MFAFELEFAGVFRIQGVPQESMQAVVLIECPRLLFPFAREIVANTVRNGGFPPLLARSGRLRRALPSAHGADGPSDQP